MAITKKILAKVTKAASKPSLKPKKSVLKKLVDESSSSEGSDVGEFNEQEDLTGSDLDMDENSSEDSEDEEEDDVTEEALERMMKLLGDVDPDELAALEAEMINAQGSDEDEDESEGEYDDEDLESEGGEYVEGAENEVFIDLDAESSVEGMDDEEEDEEEGELEFEDLDEVDGDVVPVERTTVNDKVRTHS